MVLKNGSTRQSVVASYGVLEYELEGLMFNFIINVKARKTKAQSESPVA
jgi:hypothetical protein